MLRRLFVCLFVFVCLIDCFACVPCVCVCMCVCVYVHLCVCVCVCMCACVCVCVCVCVHYMCVVCIFSILCQICCISVCTMYVSHSLHVLDMAFIYSYLETKECVYATDGLLYRLFTSDSVRSSEEFESSQPRSLQTAHKQQFKSCCRYVS